MTPFHWFKSTDFWTPYRLVFKGNLDQLPQLDNLKQQKNVESHAACDHIRRNVAQLLRKDGFKDSLDDEAIKGYEEIINKEGFIKPNDFKGLQSAYEFMKEGWEKVEGGVAKMNEQIEQAVDKKIISKDDIDFYKENLAKNVFNGKNIVDDKLLEQTEKELIDSLKKREKEREEFDKLTHHPLVKDGILKLGKGTTMEIPDEKGYLKMSVPERRKFLDQAKEGLKKAEAFSKIEAGVESPLLDKEYNSLLDHAQDIEKIMGQSTVDKFKDEFKQLESIDEKKYWIEEIKNGNQLERYRELWGNIRDTLEGDALKEMEDSRDKMGWTQLFTKFGEVKQRESTQLDQNYQEKLKSAHQNKWLSDESMRSFMEDADGVKEQDLKTKYHYHREFDSQMERYKELRESIDAMGDKKAQKELNEMYKKSGQGYTEIYAKYEELTGERLEDNEGGDEAVLNRIPDQTKRDGIIEAIEMLDSPQKLQDMYQMIEKMIQGENESTFNASTFESNVDQLTDRVENVDDFTSEMESNEIEQDTEEASPTVNRVISFQEQVQKRRQQPKKSFLSRFINRSEDKEEDNVISLQDQIRKRRPTQSKSIQPRFNSIEESESNNLWRKETNEPVDQESIDEHMELASSKGLRTFEDESFRQVESNDGQRVVMVSINDEKSMGHLQRLNKEKLYQGVENVGKAKRDHIHFTVCRNNGQEVDLELKDLQATQAYIKRKMQNQTMKKAA